VFRGSSKGCEANILDVRRLIWRKGALASAGWLSSNLWMRGTVIVKCVLLKTLQSAVVMTALCAASIAFSLGTYATPISAPGALRGASDQLNLTEAVHCGYYGYYGYYGWGYYRPYGYCRPYYRKYGYFRPRWHYRPYFSYPYRLPPPVR
jgi:hypothetical protein